MIQAMDSSRWAELEHLIHLDNARNYFIRLGLESSRPIFRNIFTEFNSDGIPKAALFERLSGNLQFYAASPTDFDLAGFSTLIRNQSFKEFIAPASLGDCFLETGCFSSVREGAFIGTLPLKKLVPFDSDLSLDFQSKDFPSPVSIEDLSDIVGLYLKVFHSFSPLPLMEKRLVTGRGRGVLIRENGELLAVAQTEFETPDSAIIVGVATHPDYQGKGLASLCMKVLCASLRKEGKTLYLQYDNPSAGRIYHRLGFEELDQIRHYIK